VVVYDVRFGGGSALEYGLRHSSDDHCPKRILCLDSWLFSLHAESIERTSLAGGLPKTCEVLFIDMELSIMEDSRCRREQFASGTTDFVTVVGAFHNNSSDFPAIVPRPLSLVQLLAPRGSDPDAVLAAQGEASAAFLNGTWPELKEEIASAPNSQLRRLAIAERGSSDSVLAKKVKQK
jgi:Platelet-activating factor acetylhydrolase, isoform II